MVDTPNHEYSRPSKGAQDWDQPLNANFGALDTDVELRDSGTPDPATYEPKDGAKYLDTSSGVVYTGDGNSWTAAYALSVLDASGALTLATDIANGGSRALELGTPETLLTGDVAGGNVLAGHPNNNINDDASGAVIAGGGSDAKPNVVTGVHGTVAGGSDNQAGGDGATVFGPTVGGGRSNTASGPHATVSGGTVNTASGSDATVGGGSVNTASGRDATVGGGTSNTASGSESTVGGGDSNLAEASYATIAGGGPSDSSNPDSTNNVVYDEYGTIGGGGNNQAGTDDGDETTAQYATVAGGDGNTASGEYATVPGGRGNIASGNQSFAAGEWAEADADWSFVWVDGSGEESSFGGPDDRFKATTSDASPDGSGVSGSATFNVKATDGVRFITATDNSAVTYISDGGTGWNTASSRTVKTSIDPVDPEQALAGVEEMEVATWEYEGEGAGTTHIGPMAEDFHDAFDVGDSDKHINSVNADGAAFAAIQGLSAKVDETRAELSEARDALAEKDERIASQAERIDDLEARLAALEAKAETSESALADD